MTRNARPTPGQILSRRTISEVRRYKVWDCSSCGVTGLNSKKCKQCPQCGNSKDASDNEERSVTEVDANYKHEGADITCEFCQTENEKRFSCKQCGAALNSKFAKQVQGFTHAQALIIPTREVQIDDTGFLPDAVETPWNDGSAPVVLKEPAPEVHALEPSPPEVKPKRSTAAPQKVWVTETKEVISEKRPTFWIAIAVAVVVVLFIFGMFVYNQLHTFTPTTARVASVSWTYSQPLEDYAARNHSFETEHAFWRPPNDAYDIRDDMVIMRSEPILEQVWVSKSCTRTENSSYDDTDGTWVQKSELVTYDCSEYETKQVGTTPIMGTRWTWKEMEWAPTTPLTARGDSHTVTYPQFVPTNTLRRGGTATTTFSVLFTYTDDDGEIQSAKRDYSRPIWEQTKVGMTFDGLVDGFDRLKAIKGLDPEYTELMK
ncbi:MAG: hypothetical protein V4606_01090 [Patescibacteria group bacterium]